MNKNTTLKKVTRYSDSKYPFPCAMVAVWRRSKAGDKQSIVLLDYQSEMSMVRINGCQD